MLLYSSNANSLRASGSNCTPTGCRCARNCRTGNSASFGTPVVGCPQTSPGRRRSPSRCQMDQRRALDTPQCRRRWWWWSSVGTNACCCGLLLVGWVVKWRHGAIYMHAVGVVLNTARRTSTHLRNPKLDTHTRTLTLAAKSGHVNGHALCVLQILRALRNGCA